MNRRYWSIFLCLLFIISCKGRGKKFTYDGGPHPYYDARNQDQAIDIDRSVDHFIEPDTQPPSDSGDDRVLYLTKFCRPKKEINLIVKSKDDWDRFLSQNCPFIKHECLPNINFSEKMIAIFTKLDHTGCVSKSEITKVNEYPDMFVVDGVIKYQSKIDCDGGLKETIAIILPAREKRVEFNIIEERLDSCIYDYDCPFGAICKDNICESLFDCLDDSDCKRDTEKCVTGKCLKSFSLCQKNQDCDKDQLCYNGECIKGNCQTSRDCPLEEVCLNGVCTKFECIIDEDCPRFSNYIHCLNGKCVSAKCRDDNDCPDNIDCINNVCNINRLSSSCLSDAHCKDSEYCIIPPFSPLPTFPRSHNWGRDSGRCTNRWNKTASCYHDEDCDENYTCDIYSGTCVRHFCDENKECPELMICPKDKCKELPECKTKEQCAQGEKCTSNRCIPASCLRSEYGNCPSDVIFIYHSFEIFDPLRERPSLPEPLRLDSYPPEEKGIYILQFYEIPNQKQRVEVERIISPNKMRNYFPSMGYIIRINQRQRDSLLKLSYVRTVAIYEPGLKLNKYLIDKMYNNKNNDFDFKEKAAFIIEGYDSNSIPQIIEMVRSLGGSILQKPFLEYVTVEIKFEMIPLLARSSEIIYIEQYEPPIRQPQCWLEISDVLGKVKPPSNAKEAKLILRKWLIPCESIDESSYFSARQDDTFWSNVEVKYGVIQYAGGKTPKGWYFVNRSGGFFIYKGRYIPYFIISDDGKIRWAYEHPC
jgi:hypothetical protein